MKTNKVKVIGSQVIAAELVVGLLLSIAYRMCSSLAFSSEAFLSLLGVCREGHNQGRDGRHLPMVDVAVFLFFLLNSLILLILDHSQLKGSLKRSELRAKPQRFFLQIDFFANFVFGVMCLVFPGWLLGSQIHESEDNLHLTRAFGAMMIGDSIASFITQKQMGTKEVSVFSSRAVGTLAVVVFMIHTQITTSAWNTPQLCFCLVGVSLWAGNSILGYLNSTDIRTESVNDIYCRAVQRKNRKPHVQ